MLNYPTLIGRRTICLPFKCNRRCMNRGVWLWSHAVRKLVRLAGHIGKHSGAVQETGLRPYQKQAGLKR
jgi:hypothetical protein